MFVWAVHEEDTAPTGKQAGLRAPGVKDAFKCMFSCAIQCAREQRRLVFLAFTASPLILSATTGRHHASSAVFRKSRQQFEAGSNPLNVLRRLPKFARHCMPRQMQKVLRS